VVTSLARERPGGTPAMGDVARAVVEGFRLRLGLEVVEDALATAPPTRGGLGPIDFSVPASLDRAGRRSVMLGALQAHWRRAADGSVAEVRLGGDVIAPVATMAAIEGSLSGAAVAREALIERVAAVLAHPEHFLLGVTPADVAEAVMAGAA
jgi:hypothetical protein